MPTNDGTLPRIPDLTAETVEAVNATALRLQLVDGVNPDTIDVHDLLTCLARVTECRFTDGGELLVVSLLELAALALLWSESADDLSVVLGDPAGDGSGERQGDGS